MIAVYDLVIEVTRPGLAPGRRLYMRHLTCTSTRLPRLLKQQGPVLRRGRLQIGVVTVHVLLFSYFTPRAD
jgi:hypothetical protein